MLPIIETPKYNLTVPSTGDTIEYRPYLVKEEKILMLGLESGEEDNMVQALRDVVESCTFGKVDAGRLTMFDIEFIFSKLRAASVGESSTVGMKCKECEATNEINIDLASVDVRGGTKDSMIKVNDGLQVKLRYPNLNDVQSVKASSDVERLYALLGKCIETVFYGDEVLDAADHSSQEIQAFIESLPSAAFNEVRKFVEGIPYTATDVHFTCTQCGTVNDKEVRGLQTFFA